MIVAEYLALRSHVFLRLAGQWASATQSSTRRRTLQFRPYDIKTFKMDLAVWTHIENARHENYDRPA